MRPVFVTGGSGYLGRPLIDVLVARGCEVHALVRPGSEGKIPPGAHRVLGNALEAHTYEDRIPAGATIVHLVGTPHPSPAKAPLFVTVDLASTRAAISAATRARAAHFVYVSAAHPAPVMRAYIAARVAGEALVEESGLPATILRPWYVLGPGHRWPSVLVPIYALFGAIPQTRAAARRLGLVPLDAMVEALAQSVAAPSPSGIRIVEVPEILRLAAVKPAP